MKEDKICGAWCNASSAVPLIDGHNQYAHWYSTWFDDAGQNAADGYGEPWDECTSILDQLLAIDLGHTCA
jgi:hypothetical protein